MSSVFWLVVLPVLYSLPCLVLYVAIVRAILRFRKTIFQSSFYYIVIAMIFTDCIVFVATTLILRFPIVPFFVKYIRWVCDNYSAITTFLLYIQFHGLHFQQFVGVLIAINRFSLVAFPLKMEIFWNNHTVKALVFTALLPACMTFHIAIEGTQFDCTVDNMQCIVNNLYVRFPTWHKATFLTVSSLISTVSSSVLNCATAAMLYRSNIKGGKATEKRLFLFSLIVFAHNLVILVIHMSSHLIRVSGFVFLGPYVLPTRTVLLDSAVVVTPITIYFLSPSIRAAVAGKTKIFIKNKIPGVFAVGQIGSNSRSRSAVYPSPNSRWIKLAETKHAS